MPTGVTNLFRNARCLARRGGAIATAAAKLLFVAIAILVVTVGVLATESRLPNAGLKSSSWYASKSSRMAECGGDELVPVETDDTRPTPRVVTTEAPIHCWLVPIELPLPELVGVPQAHGLRSPPLA